MALPKHQFYKESGVPDLGEVPAHWKVIRNRFLFREQNERSLDGKETHLCMSQKLGLVPSNDFDDKTLQSESYEGARLCNHGDLVLNRLKAHLSVFSTAPCDGLVSPDYSVFRLQDSEMVPKYFEHLFKTPVYLSEFNRRVRGIVVGFYRLYSGDFNDVKALCPPIEEQKRIIEFLDRTTTEIDRAIAQKQRIIELLQEQKAILINQAVTKGLNSNVPMCDSGIEWIGSIPHHWKLSRLGYYARVTNGSTPSRGNPGYWEDGTIPWLSSGKVNDFIITDPSELITTKALRECSIRLYPKGSVIIGMIGQGKTRGTTAFLNIEACINQNMAAIEPSKKLNSEFLHRYLIQAYQQIRDYGKGSNQEALNCDLIKSFHIVVPPIEEQVEIVTYLKSVEDSFLKMISINLKELDVISEFRSLVIANIVTGKIKI